MSVGKFVVPLNFRPGTKSGRWVLSRKSLQAIDACGAFIDAAFVEVKPRLFCCRSCRQPAPIPRDAMAFSPLQQRVGTLEVHPGSRDSGHHEIGAANAVEHCPGVDQRCAIDHQRFCLVQLALLVQDPCNQAGRQSRGHRVRADMLLRNAQPLTVMPLCGGETYLPELCDTLKAAPIYRREYVSPVFLRRIGHPGRRIELLEVTGLQMAEANDV